MGVWEWALQNWFNLFSIAFAGGGLWFTAVTLHAETKTQRITNLLTITTNHREIWKELFPRPELARVLDASVNLIKHPLTREEELFVNMVILHVSSVYYTMNDNLVVKLEGLRPDISQFFSLPIPRAVWNKTKLLQNEDFTKFIEGALK